MSSELYNTIYHIILVIYDHTDMISCKVSQWSDPHCEPQAEGRLRRRLFCNSRRTWFLKKECVDTQFPPQCVWIESLSLFDHHLCVTPKGAKRGNALSERALTMGCVSWRWEGRPLMDLLEDAREGGMKKAEVKLKKTPQRQQLCCAGVRGVRIYCVFDNFSSQQKREKRLWPSLGCIYCIVL